MSNSTPYKKRPKIVKIPQSVSNYYKKYALKGKRSKQQIIQGEKFDIGDRFKIIDVLGTGAYGVVISVSDTTVQNVDESFLAIKKVIKAFEHKIFTRRTLRELKISRLLKHENILNFDHILLPESRDNFEDIYILCEIMETDLGQVIKSNQPLSEQHVQFFLYQILRGVKYMHSAGILHRDLKPRNLLVNTNCDLKICDFGLARADLPEFQNINSGKMTEYVATRWYRAPELLLSQSEFKYTTAVDVWSIGCILAGIKLKQELLKRQPFLKGFDSIIFQIQKIIFIAKGQLELIMEVIGTPTDEEIEQITSVDSKKWLKRQKKKFPKKFNQIFPNASPECLDLLQKMLMFDPKKRISIEDALKHPYLNEYHQEEDEPVAQNKVSMLEFEFEKYDLTLQQLKDIIYEEILYYNFESFRKQFDEKVANNVSVMTHIFENENALNTDSETDEINLIPNVENGNQQQQQQQQNVKEEVKMQNNNKPKTQKDKKQKQ